MSDNAPKPPTNGGTNSLEIGLEGQGSANLIYILYLAGLFFPITALVGVILAYINRGKARDTVLGSHFTFQIRTFWIGLLAMVVGGLLSLILIGYLLLLAWVVWMLTRVITGMQALGRNQPVARVASWGFTAT
ncbi:hypothetical protein [uncultured Rhodospira sp.]|mgnify:CR=1 FL=1|uniref:DUF4870 family protein n=1 Tax=uncultured Rhodospira sp. TaxID=1936189 RepID=UPI00260E08FA|nr:hypothetical protein [uncultured Rhodospira sp.]